MTRQEAPGSAPGRFHVPPGPVTPDAPPSAPDGRQGSLGWNDVVALLAKAAAFDQRTVGEADVAAWVEALALACVTSREDALLAVSQHYATTEDRIKPVHVARLTHAMRRRRLRAVNAAELMGDVDPDDPRYGQILRARYSAVADGRSAPLAIERRTPGEVTGD